jgi:hypothetical protein
MRLYGGDGGDTAITRHGRSHVNQGGAASGQAWQFMGGVPPLIQLAAETVKAKKLEEKKKCIAICRSCSLPFLLHPHFVVTRGSVLFFV